MASLKVLITYTVYPGNPAATALSKELETKKGRLGAAVGFVLFIAGLGTGGALVSNGIEDAGSVLSWLAFAIALAILVPVMLEVKRTDRFKENIDCALHLPVEKRWQPRFPKVCKVSLIVLAALLTLFIGARIFNERSKAAAYQSAQTMMAEGRYTEARDAFKALKNYRDAKAQVNEAQYQEGLAAYTEGRYQAAMSALKDLKGDKAQKLYKEAEKARNAEQEEQLAQADALMEQEKYEEAAAFYELAKGTYNNTRAQNAWKLAAEAALGREDYAHAEELYGHIKGDEGAKGRQKAAYLLGDSLYAAGDPLGAEAAFVRAGDYSDAPARLRDARYDAAMALREAGDAYGAYKLLSLIPEYKDVTALLAEDEALRLASFEAAREYGGIVLLGRYEQDGDADNGPEIIRWRVWQIEEDKALLVAENILEEMPYHSSDGEIPWKEASLCEWLENTFYPSAFTEEEKARIAEYTREYLSSDYKEVSSTLHVFIPLEAVSYWKADELKLLPAKPSAYAAGKAVNEENLLKWWYCGNWNKADNAYFATDSGYSYNRTKALTSILGVRPALWIRLQ